MVITDRTKNHNDIRITSLAEKSELYSRKPLNPQFVTSIIVLLDVIGFLGAFGLGYWIRLNELSLNTFTLWQLCGLGAVLFFFLYVLDLYNLESQISGLRPPGRVILAAVLTALCYMPFIYIFGGKGKTYESVGRGILAITLLIYSLWGSSIRVFLTKWVRTRSKKLEWLFLGDEDVLGKVWDDFKGYTTHGKFSFLVPNFDAETAKLSQLPIYGDWNQLDDLLHKPWSGIVVEDDARIPDFVGKKLMASRLQGQRIFDLSEFYERILFKIPVFNIRDGWFTMSHGFDLLHNPIGLRVKRVFDFIMATVLFIVTAPIMVITALVIKLSSSGEVIYKQIRTGQGGVPFTIYKFRSMVQDAEKDGVQWSDKNDTRITWFGQFIRKTRIDELPQLWNVVRGDMSFIGPRPERPEINEMLEKEIPYYNLRHLVKPGITGWAQVFYEYGSSVKDSQEKLQYELYYIKNYSLLIDFAIVLKTIRVVLFGRGR